MKNIDVSVRGRLLALAVLAIVPASVYAVSLLYQAATLAIKWNKSAVQELTLTGKEMLVFQGVKVGERYTRVVLRTLSRDTQSTDLRMRSGQMELFPNFLPPQTARMFLSFFFMALATWVLSQRITRARRQCLL